MRIAGLILIVGCAPIWARQDAAGCATTRETAAERIFLHRQAQRVRALAPKQSSEIKILVR